MAPGVELSDLNWIALLAAMAVNIVLGFVWYAPKTPTGRIWMREMKFDANMKIPTARMALSFILMIVGTFFLMFVLQHNFVANWDAYKLDGARADGLTLGDGLAGGFFTWLGFFLPVGLSTVAWEMKSWTLFLVNQAYYVLTLLAAGAIFAAMLS